MSECRDCLLPQAAEETEREERERRRSVRELQDVLLTRVLTMQTGLSDESVASSSFDVVLNSSIVFTVWIVLAAKLSA